MTSAVIEVNDKTYNISVVEDEEEATRGLMGFEALEEDAGMLFPYDEEEEVSFWMKDTEIPLDIIFIDSDGNVTQVVQGKPNDETPITGKAAKVLELNINSGIEVGDQIFIIEEDEEGKEEDPLFDLTVNEMFIIGSDGTPQATIEGGERIFSRKNTVTLIKMAKKAYKSKSSADFKKLGRKVFTYLKILDGNDPEYVELPDSK